MDDASAGCLLATLGMRRVSHVPWGETPAYQGPGVYVVEAPEPLAAAPLDDRAIGAWLAAVPTLAVDGRRPTGAALAVRLAAQWVPNDRVLYVGRAGTSVARRVRAYYRTPLGARRPHAGGHWLKTLAILAELTVWWAQSEDPVRDEAQLLRAFADRHGGAAMPFANREAPGLGRKPHGITGSTLGAASEAGVREQAARRTSSVDIEQINAALQRMACIDPDRRVPAVDAAAELGRLGLLRDSASRRGKPLRDLLRAGLINHAYQEAGRWWFIECGSEGMAVAREKVAT